MNYPITDEEYNLIHSLQDTHYLIKHKIQTCEYIMDNYRHLSSVTLSHWQSATALYYSLTKLTRQDKINIYKEALVRKFSGLGNGEEKHLPATIKERNLP